MSAVPAVKEQQALVMSGAALLPVRWLKAFRTISSTTSSSPTVTAAAATVSYLRWPYG